MNYLHFEFDANAGDVIEVTLDNAANVQLLDPDNFMNYRNNQAFRYRGGYVTHSPYRIQVPQQGNWHVVVDTGGRAGTVRASAHLLSSHGAIS